MRLRNVDYQEKTVKKKMLVASFRKKNSEKDIWDDEMTLEPGEKNIIKCFEILFNALALQNKFQ